MSATLALPRGPGIRFEGLGLTLGRTRALESVDLTITPGTIHAIVGPNGGGKSSLIRCLLGQMPFRGTITLDWPGAPGRIAYVPQTLQFDAGLPMTVLDFLNALDSPRPAFLRPKAATRARLLSQLERVGMAGKADRRMGALSGGERQRVLMAQALDPAPDLLILDEPMAALDEAGAALFERLLTDLRGQGVTILWIEHDLDAVRRIACRVTALARKVRFDGPPARELTPERALDLFSHRGLAA
ncbi:metal ABC transporter ATP-binding protein [Paracoccus aminophilus]|uniref:Zinc transport system ATP-binding protein n=1 Tax=Paracoccus aminophilus JCM 7686 TaxID=1367847 RepID=S5XYV3_PARAH|nr:metal ABC transporter ATP-binding protein [Paracoccus aminophilus]AGT08615.1 zinc transport system ATP-binding protein [Paracoccus aminophilus JCM 7686]